MVRLSDCHPRFAWPSLTPLVSGLEYARLGCDATPEETASSIVLVTVPVSVTLILGLPRLLAIAMLLLQHHRDNHAKKIGKIPRVFIVVRKNTVIAFQPAH